MAYEVLYTRILSTYLGDTIVVSASVLAAFLVAIGLGGLACRRFVGWLPWVEIAIGVYAVLGAVGLRLYGPHLPAAGGAVVAAGLLPTMATVAGLVIVPALLIGFSVPPSACWLSSTCCCAASDCRAGC